MNSRDPNHMDPLQDFSRLWNSLSPEGKDKMIEEAHERRLEAEKKRREELKKPPVSPTGTCVFCKGLVSAEFKDVMYAHEASHGLSSIRGRTPNWQFLGYHCEKCGLSYKFPPPEAILTDQGNSK